MELKELGLKHDISCFDLVTEFVRRVSMPRFRWEGSEDVKVFTPADEGNHMATVPGISD